jgi:hypothetical protein
MDLLNLLRSQGAEPILKVVHDLAEKQRLEAQKALKLFSWIPVAQTKEEFWKLSKSEQKQWQKQKEEERRQLNAEANIDGRALLTKENVVKWREQGLSYGAIARDIVGCADWEVAAILKEKTVPWIKKRIN